MSRATTLAFLGDLMLGGDVGRALADRPAAWVWGDVLPLLQGTDGVIANLEGPITDHPTRWRHGWKMFHFRAPPAAVEVLTCARVGFVCLANNHMLDYGTDGLADTLAVLDAAGIGHAGAGRDRAAASAPAVLDAAGVKVGLMAATDTMAEFAATPERPGTHVIVIDGDAPSLDWIARTAQALRGEGCALVVLSLHWGPNMRTRPRRRFRRFAHAAIERGVDIVHGHSAHVVQGVERHGGSLILYDTGNMLDDYWWFPFRATHSSFVFLLDLVDGRPVRLRLVPLRLRPPPPHRSIGAAFETDLRRMARLCAAFGTATEATPEGLVIPLA